MLPKTGQKTFLETLEDFGVSLAGYSGLTWCLLLPLLRTGLQGRFKNSGENALESFLSPSDHHSAGFKAVAGNGWFEMQKEVL